MTIDNSALDDAVRSIGDRWSLRLIGSLLEGDRTFSELSAEVDGIAPNILTARLRALQRQALVVATPYENRPVRMRYALTEPGRLLAGAIRSLAEWGARRTGRPASATHDPCGTTVESRPWCPTCERVIDGDETTHLVWA